MMVPPRVQLDSPAASTGGLAPENFDFLCRTVYQQSGIVLDQSKGYLLEARLMPVAKVEGTSTLDGLCNLIRATGGERLRQKVVEAMTTNETLFFRDVKPFEALEKTLLPRLTELPRGGRPLRIWSAACSSGQEPFTLAMISLEMGIPVGSLEILGTELSEEMLERARRGRFSQLEVNRGLPAKYLVKYFMRNNMEWQIKPEVSRMVNWQKFNLKDDMARLGQFDIVLCRNVLIYFDLETKRSILGNIRRVLAPGGYLILGSSETTLNVDEVYIREEVGPAIMYRQPERG